MTFYENVKRALRELYGIPIHRSDPVTVMRGAPLRRWAFYALEYAYGTCDEPWQHPPFVN